MVDLLLRYGADPFARMPNTDAAGNDSERAELSAFDRLLSRNPDAALTFLNNQVGAGGRDSADLDSSDLLLVFDLGLFDSEARLDNGDCVGEECDGPNDEMVVHKKMVFLKLRDLLKHPLAEMYLHLKWDQTKKYFYFNIFAFGLYTLFLTGLSIFSTYIVKECSDTPLTFPGSTEERPAFGIQQCLHKTPLLDMAFWISFYLTLAASCVFLLREVVQWFFAGPRYCWRERENWLEALLLLLTIAYVFCLLMDARSAAHLGALSVFLAWIDMTLLIGRVPAIGIYIYMSVHVIRLILLFFLVYSTTLVAFALAFYLLLPNNDNFSNPITAFLKVCLPWLPFTLNQSI